MDNNRMVLMREQNGGRYLMQTNGEVISNPNLVYKQNMPMSTGQSGHLAQYPVKTFKQQPQIMPAYKQQTQNVPAFKQQNVMDVNSSQYSATMMQRLVPVGTLQRVQNQPNGCHSTHSQAQVPVLQLPVKEEPSYFQNGVNQGHSSRRGRQVSPSDTFGEYEQNNFGVTAGKVKRERAARNDNSKSLRFFSHRVCEKVKQKRQTTYNEVADELVNEYFLSTPPATEEKQQHDVKNIRRRVYDALNVLIALNIVAKEKKDIRWVGIANPLVQDEEKEMQEYVARKEEEIQVKEAKIRELLSELVGLKSIVDLNRREERQFGRPAENTILYMPYMMMATDKETFVDCNISHDKSEILCQFSGDYDIVTDQQILKKLGHTYGVETGEVEAHDLPRVRALLPPGLRHFLPSLPDQDQNLYETGY